MSLLELPGPSFLGVYLALLVIATTTAVVLSWWARLPGGAPSEAAIAQLSAAEIALLNGGPSLALASSIAALAHRGRLVVEGRDVVLGEAAPDRELIAEGVYRGVTTAAREAPLDAAVLRAVTDAGGSRSFSSLGSECAAALSDLETRPIQWGLWATRGALGRRSMLVRLPMMIVFALGSAKVVVGMLLGRPVFFLLVLLVATFVLAIFTRVKQPRTRRGDHALRTITERNAALLSTAQRAPQQLTADEVALATGVFGASVFGGSLAALGVMVTPIPAAASGSAGGSSCASTGGCGGGGCGGGGCGGCGGE